MDVWQASAWLAWVVSAVLLGALGWDFIRVNRSTPEDVLLSSRENFDELFAANTSDGSSL